MQQPTKNHPYPSLQIYYVPFLIIVYHMKSVLMKRFYFYLHCSRVWKCYPFLKNATHATAAASAYVKAMIINQSFLITQRNHKCHHHPSLIIQLRTALKRQITSSTFNEEKKNVQAVKRSIFWSFVEETTICYHWNVHERFFYDWTSFYRPHITFPNVFELQNQETNLFLHFVFFSSCECSYVQRRLKMALCHHTPWFCKMSATTSIIMVWSHLHKIVA